MSFICFRPSDPNIRHVDRLYMEDSDDGYLYLGSGTPPLCSSSHLPPPSNCTVCFLNHVCAVCSDLLKNMPLTMEGDGRQIRLTDSECPGLLAKNENADLFAADMGAQHLWWLLLLVPMIAIIAIVVFAHKKCAKKIKERMRRTAGGDVL